MNVTLYRASIREPVERWLRVAKEQHVKELEAYRSYLDSVEPRGFFGFLAPVSFLPSSCFYVYDSHVRAAQDILAMLDNPLVAEISVEPWIADEIAKHR